ncbi:MAG: restriction endonuclease subunit S [Paludibacteraceae bacterium]|nr:restriction endonuclease subunit S [Paludibacteraceae bacterium]
MELKKYKLGDIIRIESISITPKTDIKYNLYSLPSFDDNQKREEILGVNIQSNKFIVPDRCILFNKLNARFKRVWVINNNDTNKICSTEFLPLIIDETKVDFYYCYYLLISNHITNYLCGQNTNTSNSHNRIDPTNFLSINIEAPSLAEQKRIGNLLHSIDQKIALNREINQNLEAMAKQLYDYWFVQFDFPDENGKPYKSSGGKMVYNEKLKREIPEGWSVVKIKDIAQTYSGGTPTSTKQDYYVGGNIPWINSGELNNSIITSTTNFITKLGLNNSSAKLYPQNTILVALYGATAGKVSLLSFEACSNQAICGVIPAEKISITYIRYYLASLYDYFITLSSGSARDNISQDTIKNTILPIPHIDMLKKYEDIAKPLMDRVIANQKEVENLIKQRDELLPLLMNGQVSVVD